MQPEFVRVLLIDDDQDDYFLTCELVSDIPGGQFQLDWTPEYDAGVEAVRAGTHDVFLVDYRLGPRTGIELLRDRRQYRLGHDQLLIRCGESLA